jgi:hypothetical protein
VTEFIAPDLRHYCRNPRCRSKLKEPVANKRDAFCTKGCHSSFYRHRCLICESKMERNTERQLVCGKRRCRNGLQVGLGRGRHLHPSDTVSPLRNPIKSGIKTGGLADRPWRIVAGPVISANVYHCATVPDGPDCQWKDGAYERAIERTRWPF